MHDPMTLAFEIKRPWPEPPSALFPDKREPFYPSLVDIWHVDPETDGTDDSCGFVFPKFTKFQLERLKSLAWNEARQPYFLRIWGKQWEGDRAEAEMLYRGLALTVASALDVDDYTFDAAAKMASHHVHGGAHGTSDPANVFCFLSGYHCNCKGLVGCGESTGCREEHFLGVVAAIGREILRERRPWYRHPRWHFWHWEIQVHALQTLRRVLFDRCATCGGRWTWRDAARGQAVSTGGWDPPHPGWFRSRKNLHHMDCYQGARPAKEASAT